MPVYRSEVIRTVGLVRPPMLRDDLASVPAYKAGARPTGGHGGYSLASNESPFGALPGVIESVIPVLDRLNRYPDPAGTALINALAEFHTVDRAAITLGTGSVAVCGQIVTAACSPGDEVLFPWRSFEAYPIITRLAGARPVQVPLTPDGRHDLEAMLAAVSDRTRVVFLCTPNNPTGPALTAEELDAFLDRVPSDVLVVVDAAYHEYVEHDPLLAGLADGLAAARGRPNVAVLRSFSKAYGLAGLRVGFGIAPPDVTEVLRKAALPFGVSAVAQAAALASLSAGSELIRRVAVVRAECRRLTTAARSLGWAVPEAHGNFYWLPLGSAAEAFSHSCADAGVTVRVFAGEGVRVTVAEPEAGDRVLTVLAGGDWRRDR